MTPEMLYALRDPAGVPSHPLVFLLLGVLTFALHIAAVQVMLGAARWCCAAPSAPAALAPPGGSHARHRQDRGLGGHRDRRGAAALRAGGLRPVLVHVQRALGLVGDRLHRAS
jgi:hypothetical protein